MATEFKLPDLGENITSGDVVSLLIKEGEAIRPQQDVIEIETDKAVIPVPCAIGGKVSKIHVKPGETVKVGQVLLTLEEATQGVVSAKSGAPAKPAAAKPAAAAKAQPAAQAAKAPAAKPATAAKPAASQPEPAKPKSTTAPAPTPSRSGGNGQSAPHQAEQAAPRVAAPAAEDLDVETDDSAPVAPAGPAVRRLARELGVKLASVNGTGPDGRITHDDVIAAVRHATGSAAATAPARGATDRDDWGPIRREPMSKIRKTIAANMVRSAFTIPHLTNFDDADITELDRIRKGSAGDYAGSNVKITALAFLIKAVALSLRQHPTLNASVDMEAGQIIYKEYVHVGIAIDTPRGLVVPVLRDVDRMTIPHIAQAVTSLAEKAKATQYSLEDLRGGSFTISNLGAIGGTYSTPIINYPEVAVLLVGRSRKLPVVVSDRIEPRLMMPLSLSYDHRLVDGAAAARFLNEVIGYLQAPGRLLLAP
jgi:pyruvate dehydrogenase E2 component (dihydrolipoamide acetyltransferase)